ncbi:MAG: hypothetical protein ACYDC6_08830 [Acidobacteriaceae bacterium]
MDTRPKAKSENTAAALQNNFIPKSKPIQTVPAAEGFFTLKLEGMAILQSFRSPVIDLKADIYIDLKVDIDWNV